MEIGWTKPKEVPSNWDDAKIKETWTILQATYEGTKAVQDSKLQRLTVGIEGIKMEEDELFDEFYAKLKDMVNSAFNLGETILEPKIVRKVLRSLPERSMLRSP